MDDLNLHQLARDGVLAGGLGLLGRLVALSQSVRRPTGWSLLWELPLALGLGVVGMGIADWLQLSGRAYYAAVVTVSYAGPRSIDIALARWAEKKGK